MHARVQTHAHAKNRAALLACICASSTLDQTKPQMQQQQRQTHGKTAHTHQRRNCWLTRTYKTNTHTQHRHKGIEHARTHAQSVQYRHHRSEDTRAHAPPENSLHTRKCTQTRARYASTSTNAEITLAHALSQKGAAAYLSKQIFILVRNETFHRV